MTADRPVRTARRAPHLRRPDQHRPAAGRPRRARAVARRAAHRRGRRPGARRGRAGRAWPTGRRPPRPLRRCAPSRRAAPRRPSSPASPGPARGCPVTEGTLTLAYGAGADGTPATQAELVLDSTGLRSSRLDDGRPRRHGRGVPGQPGPRRRVAQPRRLGSDTGPASGSRPASTASACARAARATAAASTSYDGPANVSSRPAPRRSSRAPPTGLPRCRWVSPTQTCASPCHRSRSSAGAAFQRASSTSCAKNGRPRRQQVAGQRQRLLRRQRLLGHRLHRLRRAARHRPAGRVARPSSAGVLQQRRADQLRRLLVREVPDAVEHLQLVRRVDPGPAAVRRSRAAGSRRARRAAAGSARRRRARAAAGSADRSGRVSDRTAQRYHSSEQCADARDLTSPRGSAPRSRRRGSRGRPTARSSSRRRRRRPCAAAPRAAWAAGRSRCRTTRAAAPGRCSSACRRRSGCGMPTTASRRTTPRVQRRDRPGQHAAPVVADDHASRAPSARTMPGDVGGQRVRVVAARRLVGRAVAAQVGGDGAEAGVAERHELVPPGPPELREAVQQQRPAGRRPGRARRGGSARRWRSPRGGSTARRRGRRTPRRPPGEPSAGGRRGRRPPRAGQRFAEALAACVGSGASPTRCRP